MKFFETAPIDERCMPIMLYHFVCALFGFCVHEFPAKSGKWDIFR